MLQEIITDTLSTASDEYFQLLITSTLPDTALEAEQTKYFRLPIASTGEQVTVFFSGQSNSLELNELSDIPSVSHRTPGEPFSEAYQTMLASQQVLSRDWDQPEEDAAWANL